MGDSPGASHVSVHDVMVTLTERVVQLPGPRVVVAIDGPDAAGKTIMADTLAEALPGQVIRASIDGFHQPREQRRKRGPLSPEGYYRDTFDYQALRVLLLEPFRSNAPDVVIRSFDLSAETAIPPDPVSVENVAVLVLDGVFLLRPELRDLWDLSIYLHVDPEVTLARARERDLDWFGSVAEVDLRYGQRYLPGQELYRAEADPMTAASILIDNSEPATPRLLPIPTR